MYLFCDQEVVAQSLSGADGAQEEDEDQIQEPPVGQRQDTAQHLERAASSRAINRGAASCHV